MNVDFLRNDCISPVGHKRFGLCDDDDKLPAYAIATGEDKWIAIVINDTPHPLTFIAVDNCIPLLRANGEMDSRCDAIMVCGDTIFFVELKNRLTDWKADGIAQIENTLLRFIENHRDYYQGFRKKEAFVANRKHPSFQVIDNETMKRLYTNYKLRLDISNTILVK